MLGTDYAKGSVLTSRYWQARIHCVSFRTLKFVDPL